MRYAICNETFVDWPLDRAFAFARECGYTGIEIAPFTLADDARNISPAQRAAVRRAADAAGLDVVGLHWLLARTQGYYLTSPEKSVRRRTADYLAALARLCRELGGSVLVFGSPQQRNLLPGVTLPQAMEYAAEVFRDVAPVLNAEAVTLAVEPLGPAEGDFLLTAAEALALVRRVGSPWCRLHLDCKAMSSEARPPAELIRALAADLAHFHANDPNRQGPGFGALDFVPILRALRDVGYAGWVSVEVFDYSPGIERLARDSIAYLQACEATLDGGKQVVRRDDDLSRPATSAPPKPAATPPTWFHELVGPIRPGATLPRACYVEPRVFAHDVERVFSRGWLLAGHVSSVPRPGDYFLYDIGADSIVVIRGEGESIHALWNVCRHRGSRVCIEEYDKARSIVCPYHGWTYAPDGRLLAAPGCAEGLDRSRNGLRTCGVAVVAGLIFVSLAEPPPDFSAAAAAVRRLLAPYDLADARIAYHRRYLCPANWKLAVENLIECLAVGAAHEEFCQVFSHARAARGGAAARQEHEELLAAWRRAHPEESSASPAVDPTADVFCECRRLPIGKGFLTASRDGRPLAPALGTNGVFDGTLAVAQVLAAWAIAAPDHAVVLRLTPIETQVTEFDVTWLVRAAAVEGVDYSAEDVSWLWRATVERNLKVCSDNQLGINARGYAPGQFRPCEAPIAAFAAWYARQVGGGP